jgi:hypothetical protein
MYVLLYRVLISIVDIIIIVCCVQDPFQVSDNAGRFSRLRERHVFLFEKVLIISKKVEAPVQKKQKRSDAYVYKDHVEVSR